MQISSISSSSAAVSESRISQIEKQIQQVNQDKTMDAKTKQEMLALYEEQIQQLEMELTRLLQSKAQSVAQDQSQQTQAGTQPQTASTPAYPKFLDKLA